MGIVALTVIKLALIALMGFGLYKKKFIKPETLNFLTSFVINIAVPFLIFSRLIAGVGAGMYNIGVFFLLSLVIFFAGFCLSAISSLKMEANCRREFITAVCFQNAGYLPMNIAYFLLPAGLQEEFLVYIFLYLLGFNVLMWSIGSFFIFRDKDNKQEFKPKTILTPPVISTIAALFLAYTHLAWLVPPFIAGTMKMVGDTSFVLSMIILGCWLARVNIEGAYQRIPVFSGLSFLKLVGMPGLALIFLIKFEIFSLLGFFIVLQAAAPSAASLPIIVNLRGGDSGFISQAVFLTHALSIITIPLWLGLFLKISGLSF